MTKPTIHAVAFEAASEAASGHPDWTAVPDPLDRVMVAGYTPAAVPVVIETPPPAPTPAIRPDEAGSAVAIPLADEQRRERERPEAPGMPALVLTELRRLWWRRMTWGISAGLAVVGTVVTLLANHNMGAAPRAEDSSFGLQAAAAAIAFGMAVLGSTFAGSEFSSGSLGAWLTVSPNRGRVFWSKALAVAGSSAGIATVLSAGFLVVGSVVGVISPGADPGVLAQFVRTVVFSAMCGVGGYATGSFFKHSAAAPIAIGGLMATLAARLALTHQFLNWYPEVNAVAFVAGGIPSLSAQAAFGYLSAVLAAVVGAAWYRFSRGDQE